MKQIRYKSLNVEDVKPAEDETKHDTLPVENDGILKLLLTDIFMDIKPWAKDSNPFKNLFHFVTVSSGANHDISTLLNIFLITSECSRYYFATYNTSR